MKGLWRALACAAALHASILAGTAAAQTVIVTRAPVSGMVELALNGTTVAAAPAGKTGEATLALDVKTRAGRPEMDARIFLDFCPTVRRVHIVERGLEPPPAASGCRRRELMALFLLSSVTTLVVDANETSPEVWLRQGRAPSSWLKAESGPEPEQTGGRIWQRGPTGLAIFGGGGIESFSKTEALACGTYSDCSGNGLRLTYTAGATFWLTPFFGLESSYIKPQDYVVSGRGSITSFTSTLDLDIITIAAKVGMTAGPVRFYGQAGTNYQRSDFSTTQTMTDRTVTVDGEPVVIPGGTQTTGWRTDGWAWLYGGGAEIWINRRFALYSEFQWISLKGVDSGGGEGMLDENLKSLLAGVRFKLGGGG